MPPGVSGQGRVAQLVNPLSACSLFGVPLMTPGGAKSQVAACSDRATRRFGRGRRPRPDSAVIRPGPAVIRPGPTASAGCGPAGMERRVHAPWLAWAGLCARLAPGSGGRLTVGGPPGRAVSARPRRQVQSPVRRSAAMSGPRPPVSGRNWRVRAAGPESGRRRHVNSTSQYSLSGIGVEFYSSWPLFQAGPCTCPTQFTYHSVVGVFE